MLVAIAVGVVLSSVERARPEVAAGDFDVVADAIDEPVAGAGAERRPHRSAEPSRQSTRGGPPRWRSWRRSSSASGSWPPGARPLLVPVSWVALSARLIGIVGVVVPLLIQGRLRLSRAALPLVVIAGTGEVVGSMLSAWGSRESIAITAVMGSQFAALAAVAAFLLFGERLARVQLVGVVLIVAGVTVLAAVSA